MESEDVLRGTAGFGFWNKPFTMQGNIFTLPESVWFFYSAPPSDMQLVPGLLGWGWKAQVVHTMRPGAIVNTVPLALAGLYARLTGNMQPADAWMQKFSGTAETLIMEDMREWHTYSLEWLEKEAAFWVDDKLIMRTPWSPTQKLGFVAWIDNEYAVAKPDGTLKFGKTECKSRWLDMDSVEIEKL
jgi:hypothetical protein